MMPLFNVPEIGKLLTEPKNLFGGSFDVVCSSKSKIYCFFTSPDDRVPFFTRHFENVQWTSIWQSVLRLLDHGHGSTCGCQQAGKSLLYSSKLLKRLFYFFKNAFLYLRKILRRRSALLCRLNAASINLNLNNVYKRQCAPCCCFYSQPIEMQPNAVLFSSLLNLLIEYPYRRDRGGKCRPTSRCRYPFAKTFRKVSVVGCAGYVVQCREMNNGIDEECANQSVSNHPAKQIFPLFIAAIHWETPSPNPSKILLGDPDIALQWGVA